MTDLRNRFAAYAIKCHFIRSYCLEQRHHLLSIPVLVVLAAKEVILLENLRSNVREGSC